MTPSPDSAPHDLPGDTAEEWQSAWYDREPSIGGSAAPGHGDQPEADPVRIQDYQRLSQLLRALPVEPLPGDFASRVMAHLPARAPALLPRAESPRAESPQVDRPARFPRYPAAWLAASVAGVAILVARWQSGTTQPMQSGAPSRIAESGHALPSKFKTSPAGLLARSTLASQLNDIPPETLAFVRIRVPQRGTSPQAQDQAIGMTERAFGEQLITQATEGQRLPEALPTPQSPAPPIPAPNEAEPPVAGQRTTAGPADPMLLLVVGESEAIVNALERLLENLEQTELDEEIQSVAQAELERLSTDLNRSLEESLANLEQSWNPAGAPAPQIANRGGASRFLKENPPADKPQVPRGVPEGPSRTRGSMAWLPPDSLANSPAARALPAAEVLPRRERSTLDQPRGIEAKRAATPPEQPGRAAGVSRERSLAREQRDDSVPAESAVEKVISEESGQEEGRRPRRVLIQIICEPAG
jgi:hypothetical protein